MNSQEAKRLLEVYRPNGADAADPRFAEALDQVKQDPALARWFQEQRNFDATIASSLGVLSAPADLKDAILASRKIVRPAFWQDWRVRAAVAASVVALLVAGGLFSGVSATRFPELRQKLVEQAWSGGAHLEFESSDVTQIQHWLARHGLRADFVLPAGLRDTRLHGCRIIQEGELRVPMICMADGPKHMHLFIVQGVGLSALPPQDAPDFEKCGAWKTASWQQGDKTYVLTGMKYQTFVSKFRKSGRWSMSG